jgi:quinol monooxygenase YgiN
LLTIIARYRAKPGSGDAVAEVLARHIVATRAEQGCVAFDVARSIENPDEFVLYEKYLDDAAFEVHRESPHFKANILGAVVPMLEERTWQRYEELAPGA